MKMYETEVAQTNKDPIPLLLNMDGWVKGIGHQILTTLIGSLRPTHLVQILGETKAQIFDLPLTLFDNTISEGNATAPGKQPKLYQLPACQTLPDVSLCKIPM